MYYYNNELPTQYGWICPKCGRVNAPWLPTCDCVSSQTRATFDTTSLTAEQTEPQTNKDFKVTYTCSFTDCDNFKNFGFGEKCIECKRKQSEAKYKEEPQTEKPKIRKCIDKPFRAVWLDDDHNEIGTPQTDCPWQNDEHIPTELASTMLKNRFKEQK